MISGRTLGVILTALLVACSGGGDDQSSIDAISRADAGLQLEPTVTPAPAATSQPTAPTNSVDVPPGWKQFATESISIWLPPSFEGGEPNSVDFDLALQGLELLGQEDLVEAAELSRESIVLWMFDNEPGRLGDNVNALSVPLPSAISFSAFYEASKAELQGFPQARVIETSLTDIGGREAGRLHWELNLSGFVATTLQYAVRGDGEVCVITFTCVAGDCNSQLPLFEQSANTIRILSSD